VHQLDFQRASAGDSSPEIHEAALAAVQPSLGLRWLDVGCGRGALLRTVRDRHSPSRLIGVDLIDWLDDDLKDDVELRIAPAEKALHEEMFDRILLVETIEHLEAPWMVLRVLAGRLAPGGRMVVTTPNVANARHRVELLLRGSLTSFRSDNAPHMTPVVPHVAARVLSSQGLQPHPPQYAGRDVVPWTGGRRWPAKISRRFPQLTNSSVVLVGERVGSSRLDLQEGKE
jgi:2-polyprenyl-3-methyl-5-hydroxy-6-metoxy-1,4-benzoquinol methylase